MIQILTLLKSYWGGMISQLTGTQGICSSILKVFIKHSKECFVPPQKNEERKNMSKEEKQVLKKQNEQILEEYGFCMMDNHKQRVGNFKIEPPGLFRGRGDHPKQGKLKKRIMPESIIINIGKYVVQVL